MQEEFKEYLRFMWRDPVGRTFSIVLAVVALPYLFPVLTLLAPLAPSGGITFLTRPISS